MGAVGLSAAPPGQSKGPSTAGGADPEMGLNSSGTSQELDTSGQRSTYHSHNRSIIYFLILEIQQECKNIQARC